VNVNPINRVLSRGGMRIARTQRVPTKAVRAYRSILRRLRQNPPERFGSVVRSFAYEVGEHPAMWWDFECAFAAEHIARVKPDRILDVGSIRSFIAGLLSHYQVTTIDVRKRDALVENETVITSDAKHLDLPDASFDLVLSLCALEHFGLGRYGDEIDMDADTLAFAEMVRVLRPGGRLIFTTTIRRGVPVLAFNEQRIYNVDLIRSLAGSLTCEDERAYSRQLQRFCSLDELPADGPPSTKSWWHVYCGCWIKG
jgi:SAM-dependent methyltransferase